MAKAKLAAVPSVDTKRADTIEVREEITPAKAKEWLKQNDPCNRNLRDVVVRRYAADMAAGKWLYTGEAIKFSSGGMLLDGQHRLSAIVRSNATVTMLVIYGLPSESVLAMDSGARRDTGDSIRRLNTNVPNPKLVVSWCAQYKSVESGNSVPVSGSEVMRWYKENRTHVDALLSIRTSPLKSIGAASVWGTLVFLRQIAPSKVDAFARKLYSGAGLETEDPAYRLREMLISSSNAAGGGAARSEIAIKTISAVRAEIEGRRLARLQPSDGALAWARAAVASKQELL